MKSKKRAEIICPKCKYKWTPRVPHPKRCPICLTWFVGPGSLKPIVAVLLVALALAGCATAPSCPPISLHPTSEEFEAYAYCNLNGAQGTSGIGGGVHPDPDISFRVERN